MDYDHNLLLKITESVLLTQLNLNFSRIFMNEIQKYVPIFKSYLRELQFKEIIVIIVKLIWACSNY